MADFSSHTASLLKTEMPLQYEWTFWRDDRVASGISPNDYESNLVVLYSVRTVQDFWRAYNNISGPDPDKAWKGLYFMKKGIKPLWEDPKNERGGCLSFRVNKKKTPEVWSELLMLLIGEQLEGLLAKDDEICGLYVGARFNGDLIQLWNARADLNPTTNILRKIQEVIDVKIESTYYKAHKEHDDFKPR